MRTPALSLGDPVAETEAETVAANEDPERALENERALNALLRAVLTDRGLPEVLGECLDILLSMSWLSVLPKGGVFLVEDEPDALRLVAHRNLGPALPALCARVPFGCCLCGKAAAQRRLLQSSCVGHDHELRYEGMEPHGHYNAPILSGGEVLGVLVLYLPHGHAGAESERRFLSAATDMLALAIRQKRVEQDLEAAVRKLERLAHVDSLTQLYNRRYLLRRLTEESELTARQGRAASLLLVDVDHFKSVNDRYGHLAGDETLRTIGARLLDGARRYDVVARYGGEEFCVLLPGAGAEAAIEAAERMRRRVEADSVRLDDEAAILVSVSVGVAELTPLESVEQLLARVDEALYRAKRLGRNRVELASRPAGTRRCVEPASVAPA